MRRTTGRGHDRLGSRSGRHGVLCRRSSISSGRSPAHEQRTSLGEVGRGGTRTHRRDGGGGSKGVRKMRATPPTSRQRPSPLPGIASTPTPTQARASYHRCIETTPKQHGRAHCKPGLGVLTAPSRERGKLEKN